MSGEQSSGDQSADGVDRAGSEYARPGNYYIMEGTWVRDPSHVSKGLGVVAEVESHGPDSPREGSINILWFPNTSEHLSAWMLRRKLRDGRYVLAIAPEHASVDVFDPSERDPGEPALEVTEPWVPLVAVFTAGERGAVVVPRKEVEL